MTMELCGVCGDEYEPGHGDCPTCANKKDGTSMNGDFTSPPNPNNQREVNKLVRYHCGSPDEPTRKLHGATVGKPCCEHAKPMPEPKLYSRREC